MSNHNVQKTNNVVALSSPMNAQQAVSLHGDMSGYGLTIQDIDARQMQHADYERYRVAQTTPCYKIPYYDIDGKPVQHVRIRVLPDPNIPGDRGSFKSTGQASYVYFPPSFPQTIQRKKRNVIMVVDDERMAAFLCKKHDIPAVAIEGYAGWRKEGCNAFGLVELVNFAKAKDIHVVIWIGNGRNRRVQTEVGQLAFEIKYTGLKFSRVRQYVGDKFRLLTLDETLKPVSAFPRHPDIRQYISSKIAEVDNDKLSRKDCIEISLAMLADIEAKGMRIKSSTDGTYYYFNRETRELMKAVIGYKRDLVTESNFLNYLYNEYGVSLNDNRVMGWFATQFMAEEPLHDTTSHKIMLAEPRYANKMAFQVSDSEFVYIDERDDGSPTLAHIVLNGTNNILFERKAVTPIEHITLQHHMDAQRELIETENDNVVPMWWKDVVNTVRLDATNNFKTLLALLYYTSPWLKGWRDIQLPVEVITGEAGSGKSSLFTLRLEILSGCKHLPSLPYDLRNWQTSVINTTGIYVSDNVHLMNRQYMQQLSDEVCRIVTDLRPSIDTRLLFTTADLAKYPVNCTFGVTSIRNVFTNIDFVQRSIIVQLDKTYNSSGDTIYGEWVNNHLKSRGGREAWFTHHMIILERFLKIANEEWKPNYKSRWRLLNLEQTLILMAKVFGIMNAHTWIPSLLQEATTTASVQLDRTLEALLAFSNDYPPRKDFTTKTIVDWAIDNDDHKDNTTVTNSRRLGKYMAVNKASIYQATRIKQDRTNAKGTIYIVDR